MVQVPFMELSTLTVVYMSMFHQRIMRKMPWISQTERLSLLRTYYQIKIALYGETLDIESNVNN